MGGVLHLKNDDMADFSVSLNASGDVLVRFGEGGGEKPLGSDPRGALLGRLVG